MGRLFALSFQNKGYRRSVAEFHLNALNTGRLVATIG